MGERRAAEVFPPGEFIKEELEARDWTQIELAEILGRPLTVVNEIISGKRGITPETAKGLGDAFGTSAQYWLNLESAYRLSRTPDQDDGVTRRARLYAKVPVREMIKRRWIEPSENVDVLEKRILDFLRTDDLDKEPDLLSFAARKSTPYRRSLSPAEMVWLLRARQLAESIPINNAFSPERILESIDRLRDLLPSLDAIKHVPAVLADAGIRFLVVEHLPKTRIDGACFWLNEESPVIAMSIRFDRIDAFWHTLMHELCHVMNGDGRDQVTLDTDLVTGRAQPETETRDKHEPPEEKKADLFAAETLVPHDALEAFIARVRPHYSKVKIRVFAEQMKVHPGVVVGQLQHRGVIAYSHNREMLEKVRDIITQTAPADGWGSFPSGAF
ncbi:MAG: addiction module antidote protein, HigA family [Chloroflexota bacterium]|nr:MAG: addiction module antidote protein, HigA family [Chloroflexota bacterium]